MKRPGKILFFTLGVLLTAGAVFLWLSASHRQVAGVLIQDAAAPDPGNPPLDLRIWYPANHGGGNALPLVVISHGTGGGKTGHSGTAIALASAGFVVVAMTHTGDNYRDTSSIGRGLQLTGRPRHVSRAIDYMLGQWPLRDIIDPARIAMFGHSAGGFTALVVAGAEPDLSRTRAYCRERPDAWTCRYLSRNGYRVEDPGRQRHSTWTHDSRVKAAVIAAPAVGYSLDRAALAKVHIPVQLWAAEHDALVDDSPATIRQALPLAPEFHRVSGAGHFSFLDPCDLPMRAIITAMHWFGTEAICTDPKGFDRVRFHERFDQAIVTFFERNLPAPLAK